MSLHAGLLAQARDLSVFEKKGKPKQASLRRSVSCAYYALFHLLVKEASDVLGSRLSKEARAKLRRSFGHVEMKLVCASYAQPQSKFNPQISILLTFPISPELRNLAKLFVSLQDERHKADYDIAAIYTRSYVQSIVSDLDKVFSDWQLIRTSNNAKVFLADLLLRKSWSR
ncbi:hypothetical protein HH212_22930 [Massilia forsythiae]|uniref:HEPN domain-containing protein n=1 Tax=Massilia forsythiae TaxID=2728020 RepID=A0A7Z2VZW4_9BURK|nr:hypothetical protein [Massilia forsythiae]QJE02521.1 hypothetical protein HH212_22930 [Massilia forsythiae]